ncbi:unnamed protein product [Protopolystoma xenopodis]|uniref:Uncharacterized protein n=1 Tax=Protopolystoma xenopodis TaxID=117903 RepID=A0A3S4ZN40_9PLAT|nr:unnamed protein product [Protopolystoma xenopodis]
MSSHDAADGCVVIPKNEIGGENNLLNSRMTPALHHSPTGCSIASVKLRKKCEFKGTIERYSFNEFEASRGQNGIKKCLDPAFGEGRPENKDGPGKELMVAGAGEGQKDAEAGENQEEEILMLKDADVFKYTEDDLDNQRHSDSVNIVDIEHLMSLLTEDVFDDDVAKPAKSVSLFLCIHLSYCLYLIFHKLLALFILI